MYYFMNRYFLVILIVMFFLRAELYAQPERFHVKPAPFSSRIYDEFSPVFYKGGIVFCSNQSDNSLVSFHVDKNGQFKLFYLSKIAYTVCTTS